MAGSTTSNYMETNYDNNCDNYNYNNNMKYIKQAARAENRIEN